MNFSTLSNNIACFCDKLLISRPTQYFHVYSNDTICPVLLASKQCETYGDDRKENDREKFYITIVKWTNRVENGVKRRVDGSFHWRAQNLWHSARRRGGGGRPRLRLYRFPVARMRESIIRFHIFFFFSSLCIFSPLFFFPPSPIRSSLYRSNDSRYLRRCYRTALLSKEFICNCAVLMSEGDVRWYRNCFRMIDDGQM